MANLFSKLLQVNCFHALMHILIAECPAIRDLFLARDGSNSVSDDISFLVNNLYTSAKLQFCHVLFLDILIIVPL